jgi:hypothetical protein
MEGFGAVDCRSLIAVNHDPPIEESSVFEDLKEGCIDKD